MILLIYEEGSVSCISIKNVFILSEEVIDECLVDSIEKLSK